MIRLSRRLTLFALVAALAPFEALGAPLPSDNASPAPPLEKRLVFKILRKGSPIGQYTMDVTIKGKLTTVNVTTQIKVDVLFITAYQLSHSGREIWNGDHFISYKGQTNDNGKEHVVAITADKDHTSIVIDGHRSVAPKGAIPASLWKTNFLDETMLIDPDNGRQVPVKVVDVGPEPIVLQGAKETAEHYHIEGLKRDVWMVDGWPVRFQLIGSDNSTVVSELQPSD